MESNRNELKLIQRYIQSIWIDRLVLALLLVGFILVEKTIKSLFWGYGDYVFYLYIFLVIYYYFVSDRTFKYQSIGKMFVGLSIYGQNSEDRASIVMIIKRRLLELFFFSTTKKPYYEGYTRVEESSRTSVKWFEKKK